MFAALGKNSPWKGHDLYGLAALILVNLVSENKDVSTSIFIDPRAMKPSVLSKARVSPAQAEEYFQKKSLPVAIYLEKMGVSPPLVSELLGNVKKSILFLVMEHLLTNFRGAAKNESVVATKRDALTQRVMVTILTLLMWIDGVTVKTILDRIGVSFQEHSREGLLESLTGEPGISGEITPSEAPLDSYLANPDGKPNITLDFHSFPYRYCDKVVLLLDSYMVYGNMSRKTSPEQSRSLDEMTQRVRYGMRMSDAQLFLSQVRDPRQRREEWLMKKG
jgi:hypothetical protein